MVKRCSTIVEHLFLCEKMLTATYLRSEEFAVSIHIIFFEDLNLIFTWVLRVFMLRSIYIRKNCC